MTTKSPEQLKAEWDAHAREWSRKAAREAELPAVTCGDGGHGFAESFNGAECVCGRARLRITIEAVDVDVPLPRSPLAGFALNLPPELP